MQLQNEEIGDGANAQDHHAQDVDRRRVLGVDRAMTLRPGRKEQLAVALVDDAT